jgi:subtilisin-like proprotein convertase family protein
MITRFVILMLIAALALPVATLTRPTETNPSPWGDVAVEAKGKKHKHKKKPKFKTVRKEVTRTFASGKPILIPAGAPASRKGPADPYPAAIDVSGFKHGEITDVNLVLTDLTHSHYDDLDVLLSTSDGHRALVMSDVGDIHDVADEEIDLVLDDEAAASMPGEGEYLRSGTFRPTNLVGYTVDTFDAPAPAPDGNVALSSFDGANPNGTWQVWVMDNSNGNYGDIGSWALEITAEVDVEVKAKQKKHKKHR